MCVCVCVCVGGGGGIMYNEHLNSSTFVLDKKVSTIQISSTEVPQEMSYYRDILGVHYSKCWALRVS